MKLDISRAKTLLFPFAPTEQTIHMNEGTLYTGILAVMSLPFTVVNLREKPRVGFFAVSVVIMMLLIFTDVLNPIFRHLPMINTSVKIRVIVLLNFSLAVLVGINIDDLLIHRSNTSTDKRRRMLLCLVATVVSAAMYAAALWWVYPVLGDTPSSVLFRRVGVSVACVFVVIAMVMSFTSNRVVSNVCTVLVLCAVAADMGTFASLYQPLIERDAPAIPDATDSVSYLQRNTGSQEKIMTLGEWDFYPSSNVYYGIRSISGHGLVYTDRAISTYYKGIASDIFDQSRTRPILWEPENENLMKYMGVKYLVGTGDEMTRTCLPSVRSRTTIRFANASLPRRVDCGRSAFRLG